MKKKTQIFFVHGGMTFKNNKDYVHFLKTRKISIEKKISWSNEYIGKKLGKDFEIIRPRMPLQDNAKYADWKILFERYFPHLRDGVIIIGMSLGGIFLAKYFSENKFPKRMLSLYLVCPPYDNTLAEEDLAGGFKLRSDLTMMEKNAKNLYLMFSKDDDVIPISHAKKYHTKLKNARIIIYKSKNGHFQVPQFPEIVSMIKNDVRQKRK